MDPARFLYPLVQGTDARGVEWPLQTTSGEVLLVELRGDEVLYLNELRYRKGAALRVTAPASELDLPAAKALRGEQGVVEGVDYRGVPVIAGLRPVPGTPWFIVAKVDAREVLGPITRRGWITVGFTLLMVALAAAGTVLLWRARESRVTASLLASEIRFRSLFASMAEGVALHELVRAANGAPIDYRILQVNRSFSERMGLAAEKVRGRLASEVYGTPVAPFLDRYAQAVTDDKPQQFEAYLEPLGKHFDISVVPQGEGGRFAAIFEDITERKRAEEELRASERKFRKTVETLDEGYYSVSLDGILLDHNPAYCLLQGYDADADLRGQLSSDVWRDPADREAYVAQLQANGAVHNYVARTRARDGADQVLLMNAHLVRDERGEVTRIDGSSVDFTAHREAADRIERLNAELEQRVRERTAELDAANKELEAFAYTVSHDLRAPLRHISGFSSLLTRRAGDSLDEKGRHYVDTISSSVREMGVLIDDLLQFSRTGRAELQIELVDMNAALAEALAPLQHETDGRIIDWSIGTLPSVMGDHALLRQVWANLLGNAVKYTRGRTPAHIEVRADSVDGEVVFFVRDNGVGFDMQYAHKLFGVFQRLHSASEFEGTGIGLANVQRIVTRLGGRVWAEAEVERGAIFFFSLPRQKERQ
jgi:PAS domain S-box-containing protein